MRKRDKLILLFLSMAFVPLLARAESPSIRVSLFIAYFLLVFLLIYRLERVLNQLLYLIRRLSSGDYKVKSFVEADDVLGRLFYELNELSVHLEALVRRISQVEGEIEAFLDISEEPLVLMDEIGRIVKANEAFARLLGEDPRGKWYWEVIKDRGLFDVMDLVRSNGRVEGVEVVVGDRFFAISGLASREGIFLFFRDVTDRVLSKKRESDLVSNIAHEFKTPLTAIRGAIEAIEEGGELERFLPMIKRNADRLIKIASDLLLLYEAETFKSPEIEAVNLKNLVEGIVELFLGRAKERGLSIVLDLPEEEVVMNGDRLLLESAIINLVDNAIKYNVDGGRIIIRLFRSGKELFLEVEDTGVGIPKEHIPFIFDKFYVVDRSRSRRFGGAGLGLSLVRSVVSLHGGRIDVQSELGRGSKFTMVFPT